MQLAVDWSDGLLGLACLLAGLFHIGMLLAGRARFAPAAAHAAMGIGMAAMFVPAAVPVPRPVWVALFLVITAWFAAAGIRAGSLLGDAGAHVVGAVAMLYMLLGPAHGGGATHGVVDSAHVHHGGGSGAATTLLLLSLIALGFAAWFICDVVGRLVRFTDDVRSVPESVGAGTDSRRAAGNSVRAGVARAAAVPGMVMSAAMAVMFLGMV
jgi:hypothetical protein